MTEFQGSPRDWLRSKGYNVGERGRLSVDSSGLTFVESSEDAVVFVPEAPNLDWRKNPHFDDPMIRESRTLFGFSREGYKIGFSMCFACTSHMSRCKCKGGVMAPPTIVSTKEKDVRLSKHPLV
jgi:hypothetical protein